MEHRVFNLLDPSKFGPMQSKQRPLWTISGRYRSIWARVRRTWPDSVKFRRARPNSCVISAKLCTCSANFQLNPGLISANSLHGIDQIWPGCDQVWCGIDLREVDRNRLDGGLILPMFNELQPNSTDVVPMSAEFGLESTNCGRCVPSSDDCALGKDFINSVHRTGDGST